MRVLVTGGAGFIGSAVVRRLMAMDWQVLNLDKLTYAANLSSLDGAERAPGYRFVEGDVCDRVGEVDGGGGCVEGRAAGDRRPDQGHRHRRDAEPCDGAVEPALAGGNSVESTT